MVSWNGFSDVMARFRSGRVVALCVGLLAFAGLSWQAAAQGVAVPDPPVPRLHGQWAGPYELPLDSWGGQQYCTGEIVHMAVLPPPIEGPPLRTNHLARVMFVCRTGG